LVSRHSHNTGGQAPLLIAYQSVRGHCDDRNVAFTQFLDCADRRCRFKTIHARHLDIHKHQFEPSRLERSNGSLAVGSDSDGISALLKDTHGKRLIHGVIFSQLIHVLICFAQTCSDLNQKP